MCPWKPVESEACRGDPPASKVTLWSTCTREATDPAFMERLRSYPVEAIKVHLPLGLMADIDHPAAGSRLAAALEQVSSGSSWRFPVYLYVPMGCLPAFNGAFAGSIHQLGVERLYAFTKERDDPLNNAAACFGKDMGSLRLLWARE